jgi:hypothetical protein
MGLAYLIRSDGNAVGYDDFDFPIADLSYQFNQTFLGKRKRVLSDQPEKRSSFWVSCSV